MKRKRWESETTCNNFNHIMKAYAFSLGSESCTRSLQGENSLSLALPGAAGSPAGGRGRERSAAPSPGTPMSSAGEGPRAGPPLRALGMGVVCGEPPSLRSARPGERGPGPAGRRGAVRGSGVSLWGPLRRGRLPCPPSRTRPSRPPFYSRLLPPPPPAPGPAPARDTPSPGPPIPASSGPSGRSPSPFCVRPLLRPCPPPPPSRHFVAAPSLPPSPLGRARPPEPARSPS